MSIPASDPSPGPVRRALLALGGMSAIAGIALLAAAIYSFAVDDFTTSEDRGSNAALRDLTEDAIDLDIPPAELPPAEEAPAAPPAPPLRDSGYQLVIEKLGINAPVSTFGLDADNVPQVPYTAGDVAWYDFSARPGTGGNAVFAGHVTWNGAAVFYNLDQVQTGDQVLLQGDDGTRLVYQVSSVFQVDPADPDSLKVMWATDRDVMTIITCSGKFVDTDDPIFGGEYTNRLVVRADLLSVDPPPAAGG